MDREEQWKRVCASALPSALAGEAEIVQAMACTWPSPEMVNEIDKLRGPERVAVHALLFEAIGSDDEESAVACVALAAAMVEQRGRVLGALRAAKAVEDALWPDEAHVVAPRVDGPHGDGSTDFAVEAANRLDVDWALQIAVVRAVIDSGLGPQPEGAR